MEEPTFEITIKSPETEAETYAIQRYGRIEVRHKGETALVVTLTKMASGVDVINIIPSEVMESHAQHFMRLSA